MKKLLLMLSLIGISLFTACGVEKATYEKDDCQVVIENSKAFYCQNPVKKVENNSAEFILHKALGYELVSCDYPFYELEELGDNSYRLTVNNVKYSTVVALSFKEIETSCTYYPNLNNEKLNEQIITVKDSHLTTNTPINLFECDGYTLVSYNTQSDGVGASIGVGSRFDNKKYNQLYGQWEKWTSDTAFQTEEKGNGLMITGFIENMIDTGDTLCIPETINGKPVLTIGKNAFEGLEAHRVILPKGLFSVEGYAFKNSMVQELYFYDSIEEFSDYAFDGCKFFNRVHINSCHEPCYTTNYFASFCDKMDYLQSVSNQKKLILFSGSSARFGYDSSMLESALKDYKVVNMGVFAYSNALPQLDLILNYVGEGDILLHSPEFDAAKSQFCVDKDLDKPFFAMIENNYDLLSLLDVQNYYGLFSAYSAFAQSRRGLATYDYDDSCISFDEDGNENEYPSYNSFGDYVVYRENAKVVDAVYGLLVDYSPTAFNRDIYIKSINSVYEKFYEKGANCYFTYAPRNKYAIKEGLDEEALDEYFSTNLRAKLIGKCKDSLLEGTYLYGTDNHLSTEGVALRTSYIIERLKEEGL